MNRDISKELSEFIRDEVKIPEDDLDFNADVDLLDYGYLDSFSLVSLMDYIEKEYSVSMADADFYEDLRTINHITSYIKDKS